MRSFLIILTIFIFCTFLQDFLVQGQLSDSFDEENEVFPQGTQKKRAEKLVKKREQEKKDSKEKEDLNGNKNTKKCPGVTCSPPPNLQECKVHKIPKQSPGVIFNNYYAHECCPYWVCTRPDGTTYTHYGISGFNNGMSFVSSGNSHSTGGGSNMNFLTSSNLFNSGGGGNTGNNDDGGVAAGLASVPTQWMNFNSNPLMGNVYNNMRQVSNMASGMLGSLGGMNYAQQPQYQQPQQQYQQQQYQQQQQQPSPPKSPIENIMTMNQNNIHRVMSMAMNPLGMVFSRLGGGGGGSGLGGVPLNTWNFASFQLPLDSDDSNPSEDK